MKWIMMILICVLLFNMNVQASDTIPWGVWEVTQVTIEKNTDGRRENRAYNANTNDKNDANADGRNENGNDNAQNGNTNNRNDNSARRTASSVQSYVRCPHSWEVKDSTTIVLHYPDGTEKTGKYTIEGDHLLIDIEVAMLIFQYSISDEKMTFRIRHDYVNNLPTDRSEKIEEKWAIDLIKNKPE